MGSVSWRKRGNRYLVSWRLDDGSQGGKTVDTPDEARDLAAEKRLEMRHGTWRGRQRGRLPFSTWATDDPSPTTLAATESWLRLHVRPWFADRPIDKITPADVRRWQAQLARDVGRSTLAHCCASSGRTGARESPRPVSAQNVLTLSLQLLGSGSANLRSWAGSPLPSAPGATNFHGDSRPSIAEVDPTRRRPCAVSAPRSLPRCLDPHTRRAQRVAAPCQITR
jgi:hypothetical protein